MFSLLKNLLASRNDGWEQLVILVIIVGGAILKKIFSAIHDYSQDKKTEQKDDDDKQKKQQEWSAAVRRKNSNYGNDVFKTIQQIRDEKVAEIRKAYGISEPKVTPEPELLEQEPVRLEPEHTQFAEYSMQMSRPKPEPKPAYIPPKKTFKKPVEVTKPQFPPVNEKHKPTTAAKVVKNYSHGTLIHLSSQEDLRSAILYQEILGKPLALRE